MPIPRRKRWPSPADFAQLAITAAEIQAAQPSMVPFAMTTNGTSAYRTHDALAPYSYLAATETDAHVWHIWIAKAETPTNEQAWIFIGGDDATGDPYLQIVNNVTGADAGNLRAVVVNAAAGSVEDFTGSNVLQGVDGRFHFNQLLDERRSSTTGRIHIKTDGGSREDDGDYTRPPPDGSWPLYHTMAAVRRDNPLVITNHSAMTAGYYALVNGANPSDAQQKAVFDSFDTGGGRVNTRVVTQAIRNLLASIGGTLIWAGDCDGNRTPAHHNSIGAPPPIYVGCTFAAANYDLTRWGYFGGGAYALCSAANAQEVEDVYDASGGDISYLTGMEADPVLGGTATFRTIFGIAQDNLDTGGSSIILGRDGGGGGEFKYTGTSDASGSVGSGTTTEVGFAGTPNLFQLFDTAAGTTGTLKAKVNSTALETIDASYNRTLYGVLDLYSPAGFVRGPTPVAFSPLGWVYWHISVAADLESIHAAISTAYAAAVGQLAKYLAVYQVVIDGGFESAIIYAQCFVVHNGIIRPADKGDDATLTGVTYTAEGVSP